MKIFVRGIHDERAKAALTRLTGEDELWFAESDELSSRDLTLLSEAEVFLGAFPAERLPAAPGLRWVQFISVGIDTYPAETWAAMGAQVTCTTLRGVFAEPMAQTVLAGILAFERGLDVALTLQAKREWQKSRLHAHARILRGAHVLLLGGGSVGTRVRELLSMFGCTFTTFARTSGDISTAEELDAALPRADIVCASLPETPATRGLIDARRMARMKPGALLVNVGRGSLLDEAALIRALRSGAIRGALLDVTRNEPLPLNDPLWQCPRVWLTQHSAAGSFDELVAAVDFFGANLARYRSGEPLLNVVNWARGY